MSHFIRLPVWVNNPNIPATAKAILIFLFSLSYYRNNDYSPIHYSPSKWTSALGLSEKTIIEKIKLLVKLGFIIRSGSTLLFNDPGNEQPKLAPITVKQKSDLSNNFHHKKEKKAGFSVAVKEKPKNVVQKPENEVDFFDYIEETFSVSTVSYKRLSVLDGVSFDEYKDFLFRFHKSPVFKRAFNVEKGLEDNGRVSDILSQVEKSWEGNQTYFILLFFNYISKPNTKNPIGAYINAVQRFLDTEEKEDFYLLREVNMILNSHIETAKQQERMEHTKTNIQKLDAEKRKALEDEKNRESFVNQYKDQHVELMAECMEQARVESAIIFRSQLDSSGKDQTFKKEAWIKKRAEIAFTLRVKKLLTDNQ